MQCWVIETLECVEMTKRPRSGAPNTGSYPNLYLGSIYYPNLYLGSICYPNLYLGSICYPNLYLGSICYPHAYTVSI